MSEPVSYTIYPPKRGVDHDQERTADERQIGGNHYLIHGHIQPWHAMEQWMSAAEFRGFLRGNVIKYIARCNEKGGAEDLRKARHYLDKLIEVSG